MEKLLLAVMLLWCVAGCSAYEGYQKAVVRTVSPTYRAYERQQQAMTPEQREAQRKQGCVQLGC